MIFCALNVESFFDTFLSAVRNLLVAAGLLSRLHWQPKRGKRIQSSQNVLVGEYVCESAAANAIVCDHIARKILSRKDRGEKKESCAEELRGNKERSAFRPLRRRQHSVRNADPLLLRDGLGGTVG